MAKLWNQKEADIAKSLWRPEKVQAVARKLKTRFAEANRVKRCFKPVVEVKVHRVKNGFTLKVITLRLQVVKVVVIRS